MPLPKLSKLQNDTRWIVRRALLAGNVGDLTPHLVRAALEEKYGLEEDALDVYKKELRTTMDEAAVEDASDAEEESDGPADAEMEDPLAMGSPAEPVSAPPTPERLKPVAKKDRGPAKRKSTTQANGEASDADGPSSAPPSKKRRKPSKAAVESDDEGLIDPSPKSKRKKASAKKDAAEEPATSKPASAKPASKAKRPPAKRSSHAAAEASDSAGPSSATSFKKRRMKSKEFVESDKDESAAPPADAAAREASTSAGPKTLLPAVSKADEEQEAKADASDSEMSVLIDATPVKKPRKGKAKADDGAPKGNPAKSKAKEKKEPKSRTKKEPAAKAKAARKTKEPVSKDEETIKRLKALVVACGVRRPWAREFADMPRPAQQIAHIRVVLAELGLGPRAGMEQARAVREKRELEQELADVREFESRYARGKAAAGGDGEEPSEGRRRKTKRRARVEESDEEHEGGGGDGGEEEREGGEDEDAPKPAKRANARKSILAFLEDQSDDE